MGEKMFIMCRIGCVELALDANNDEVWTFNKIHVGCIVQVDWGMVGWKENGDTSWKGLIQQSWCVDICFKL